MLPLALAVFVSDPIMQEIFGDEATHVSWLQFEVALAHVQAELGIIPTDAARLIEEAATRIVFDRKHYLQAVSETKHPLVPVLRQLMAEAGDAGAFVHFGASSQDTVDTGLIMQCKRAFEEIQHLVTDVTQACLDMAQQYAETPMVGRTHGQHAVPTTFGLRAAVWADQWEDHSRRLSEARPRLLVGSFGGATGTLAGYGVRALETRDALMARLGLDSPDISWHSAYERLAEYVSLLALLSATAERIASDIFLLGRPEIDEVREGLEAANVGSSTMPHKQNPVISEAIAAAAASVRSEVALAYGMVVQRDDRDLTSTFLAMKLIPEVSILTAGLLRRLRGLLRDVAVRPNEMARNLRLTGATMSENVMLELSKKIGRSQAHAHISRLSTEALARAEPLGSVLKRDELIIRELGSGSLEELLEPMQHLGQASAQVQSVKKKIGRRDGTPPL